MDLSIRMKYKSQQWTSTLYWTVFDRISYEAGIHYNPRLMYLVVQLKTKGNEKGSRNDDS